MPKTGAIIGVSDHGGWAVMVTVASDGTLLDRRRVELVDDALPAIPHHHEAQTLPMKEAVALVERVRASAQQHAVLALNEVAGALVASSAATQPVLGIALRVCPPLPPTVEKRMRDYRARNVADWVMYREALASAAAARGWPVSWYDPKTVFESARQALIVESLDTYFSLIRRNVGPPWNADHRLAMSAAISAFGSLH